MFLHAPTTASVSTRSRPKAADNSGNNTKRHEAVSTRSRPKAAEYSVASVSFDGTGFNTQPPEGG